MTRFWNNLHQVRSKIERLKRQITNYNQSLKCPRKQIVNYLCLFNKINNYKLNKNGILIL